ncbi:hypothetical protein SO802_023849 [Lithocarpus litseifolius]|uniref:Uncharacterized protein n=1 Tax=Lithocarpus litseifolius TaxID=425828 RepID=A0AAW2C7E6_9ROSI
MSPHQVESTTKKLQRGSNFSIEEEILLASAFLNVNQDIVQSNNQKRKTYWSRIWEYYHKWKTFTSERTAVSLMNRWSTIQLATNKCCGFLSQIESKNKSGKTKVDKLDAARTLYQAIQGTKFQYEHYDDDVLQVPIVNLERPLGVKAEKERLKKQKCKEEANEMEKLEDNKMEKFRMKQVKEETEIMMMDVSAIANLVDEVGGAVVHVEVLPMNVSVDMSISFLSTAKLDVS